MKNLNQIRVFNFIMLRKITYSRTVITTQLKNTYPVVILIKYLHSFHYYFVTVCENQFFSKGKFHIIFNCYTKSHLYFIVSKINRKWI